MEQGTVVENFDVVCTGTLVVSELRHFTKTTVRKKENKRVSFSGHLRSRRDESVVSNKRKSLFEVVTLKR